MSTTHPSPTHKERLRDLVQLAGITSDKLSSLAGLSQAHVGMLIRGDIATMRSTTAKAIASITGCSLDWLLSGDGAPPTRDGVRAKIAEAIAAQTTENATPPEAA